MKKRKFRISRFLPALTVDASTHAALMFELDRTGDSLANLMNQMLVLGLKKYGLCPSKFRPDLRRATDVLNSPNHKARLMALAYAKGRFPAFFVPRDLQELVRLHQGTRQTSEIMAEALRLWLTAQGPYRAPELKERAPVKRRKRQRAMLLSENPPDLMRERAALIAGIPLSSLKESEDFA